MLEVGKKYKYQSFERIHEVLYIGERSAFFRSDTGHEWALSKKECSLMVEYHEPVIVKYKKYIYNPDPSCLYACTDCYNKGVIGEVEFTVTDGKLTGARVL